MLKPSPWLTTILVNGVDWYRKQGINNVAGLKFVGISGDVVRPGVFEVPMGTSYRDLIYKYAEGITQRQTPAWDLPRPGRRQATFRLHRWTCRLTSTPWLPRAPWWAPAQSWFAPRDVACSTWH